MEKDRKKTDDDYNRLEEVGVPDQESDTPTGRLTMRSLNPRYKKSKTHKGTSKK